MIVAIHQPNYMPWLGYFAKIARADAFVFLGEAQFSKGSYTNRVRILMGGRPRWLTVPVSFSLGDPVSGVAIGDPAFARSHLSLLRNAYAGAPAFTDVWPEVERLYDELPATGLAGMNAALIERLARRLGISTRFLRDDEVIGEGDAARALRADDRLVEICRRIDPAATYLSGEGGRKYQDEDKFAASGLGIDYSSFEARPYPQAGAAGFVPGLSVLDAAFNLGWERTGELLRPAG